MENHRIKGMINIATPQQLVEEVESIVLLMYPNYHFRIFRKAIQDLEMLFTGEYPGYQACNTLYHDFQHTLDALLAMARLIHGAFVKGKMIIHKEEITLALLSALFHDSGYIQTRDDTDGTGAKYTLTHIQRSIDFMERYFQASGFLDDDFQDCSHILHCTGLNTKTKDIPFRTRTIEMLGKMLGTADLLGQMADRLYLEKLLLLYHEFQEGKVRGYVSEVDFLMKTIGFYQITKERLKNELSGVNQYLRYHFRARWDVKEDLYATAMAKNIQYLGFILEQKLERYRDYLRRGGIVHLVRKRETDLKGL